MQLSSKTRAAQAVSNNNLKKTARFEDAAWWGEALADTVTEHCQRISEHLSQAGRDIRQQAGVGFASIALVVSGLALPGIGATPASAADVPAVPVATTVQQEVSANHLVVLADNSPVRMLGNLDGGLLRIQQESANPSDGQAQANQAPAQAENAAPAAQAAPVESKAPAKPMTKQEKFIASVAPAAQESERDSGVPAAVTIAQAILESNWGESGLSVKAHNYFGIKAMSGPGPAGTISMDTWEVFGGKDTVVKDAFKAYNNLDESIMDHGNFLKNNARYAAAFNTTDPEAFASKIHKAGYATDPAYTSKLVNLMAKYDLFQYGVSK